MYFTYILRSVRTGQRYIGQTQDIASRLEAHNSGNSPYTKGRGPWELIHTEQFSTRSDAMKREKFLKSGKGREWMKNNGI